MSRLQKFGLLGLSGHLFLVLMGTMSIDVGRWSVIGFPLYLVSELTGANRGFGFFAPGVGSDIRAKFEVFLPSGNVVEERLQRGLSHEADLRVGNIVGKFWEEISDESRRRALTASWAGKMLARHPGAKAVKVCIETYELPAMQDFVKGEKPSWENYYEAKFVLR